MTITTNQDHFRIRTDTTAAEGGTPIWAAAQDTNVSLPVGQNFRIRFAISDSGSTSTSTTYSYYYVSRNAGAYGQVNASSTYVKTVDATNGASSNDSSITTQLLTGNGTFTTVGVYNDTTGQAPGSGFILPAGDCAEFEFGTVLTASAAIGDTYDFRIYLGGVAMSGTYFNTPRVTVAAPAASPVGSPVFWFG